MKARRIALVLVALAAATLFWISGCGKNENPVKDVAPSSRLPYTGPVPFEVLRYSPLGGGDDMNRIVSVAYSSVEPLSIDQPPLPVLYLLHDFEGDGDYFDRYRLQVIMDDMFQKGEIGRMMVVTVGADTRLGGSFYRNSVTAGKYEELITATMNFIERNYQVYTEGGRSARAISGHGMGGYGAMRYAAENPELFSSVSSMSGPLSLGAVNGSWLAEWTDKVLTENSARGDSAAFFNYIRADQTPPFVGSPYTKRFYAMAATFSPRALEVLASYPDTCLICRKIAGCKQPRDYDSCFACSVFAAIPLARTTLTTYTSLQNRPSLIDNCSDPVTPADLGLDFPFDWNGTRVDSVWNLWMSHDVKTYVASNPSVFSDIDLYFDCGAEDEFGFLEQNRDFDAALSSLGIDHVYTEYSSSQGLVANHSNLIAERLREILKFHSDRLQRPPGPDNPE